MRPSVNRKIENNAGLSLVEVLIALSVLSIGILAVASLQFSSEFLSRNSADITNASNLASDQMERLMLLPFTHADLTPGTVSGTSGKYSIRWDVADVDLNSDGVNEAKTINLTVRWNNMFFAGPTQKQVQISFIKHDTL
jgi:type IV pilus assembly protein PilV